MGVIRGGKQATAQWLRSLDRMIESQNHQVFVIQDKRALRDFAREFGTELLVGDSECAKHDGKKPKAKCTCPKPMRKSEHVIVEP